MNFDDLIKIGTLIFGVGSVYGLVRADIRHLHDRLADIIKDNSRIQESVDKAHDRLDSHITDYHRK